MRLAVEEVLARGEPSRARYPDAEGMVTGPDGVGVFYEVYGHGPDTVCLLPPWAMFNSRSWRGQIPYLSRHFRVIAIDPRGNGRSDRPRETAAYSRAAHVADVIRVLDETGTDRAMMVSLSPRAVLAVALAIEHPERVQAIACITPQLWAEKGFVESWIARDRGAYSGYEKFNPRYWRQDFRGYVEWFAGTVFPHPRSTRQIEQLLLEALETDGETLIPATIGFEMYGREEALELAAQIRCQVLITQNGGDAFWPKECSGPFAAACGGRLHVFEGLGPAVAARWPVAMNLVLREFFDSVVATEPTKRAAVS